MARSMTGFGAASLEHDGGQISVEIRSVNHRFLDVKPRLPRDLAPLEAAAVARVRARLERGSVELTVRRSAGAGGAGRVRLDLPLARDYADRLAELGGALGLGADVGLLEVASLPGVLALEEPAVDLDRLESGLAQALDQALEHLVTMRATEGAALGRDLTARLQTIRQLAGVIEEAAPQVVEAWRERLQARVEGLSVGVEIDPQRIAAEVALFADRSDISEELTRLRSHLDHFAELLAQDGPVGRKLDFLVQEMNREVNTIGSKAQSAGIAQSVVDLKSEIERIREQVQNIE